MVIFLDANILAKAFYENPHRQACRTILSEEFITDSLCVVETGHVLMKVLGNKETSVICVKSLYKCHGVIIPLDHNVIFETLRRLEKYQLTFYDMVHYVCALLNNCEKFISYDKAFDGLEIKRVEP